MSEVSHGACIHAVQNYALQFKGGDYAAAATTTAEFSAAATTGGVTGEWQVAEIGDDPEPANSPETLYVVVQDSAGKSKAIDHPNPPATSTASWQQ